VGNALRNFGTGGLGSSFEYLQSMRRPSLLWLAFGSAETNAGAGLLGIFLEVLAAGFRQMAF